jgi:hypothetical protein
LKLNNAYVLGGTIKYTIVRDLMDVLSEQVLPTLSKSMLHEKNQVSMFDEIDLTHVKFSFPDPEQYRYIVAHVSDVPLWMD